MAGLATTKASPLVDLNSKMCFNHYLMSLDLHIYSHLKVLNNHVVLMGLWRRALAIAPNCHTYALLIAPAQPTLLISQTVNNLRATLCYATRTGMSTSRDLPTGPDTGPAGLHPWSSNRYGYRTGSL
eukprot:scaffold239533_cov15-Prasinocladus_malaysianus.AAC.1